MTGPVFGLYALPVQWVERMIHGLPKVEFRRIPLGSTAFFGPVVRQ